MSSEDHRWALMTVSLGKGDHSLAEAAESLSVPEEALDSAFGIVPVDHSRGLYAVQVDADQIMPQSYGDYRGPYSDPEIAPFSIDTKK